MPAARAEPFYVAVASLHARLRDGAYAPGARISVVDTADDLRLSATPVREALAYLAGSGVLEERRGQGFFVRHPSATDVADLYRLSLAHLLIAQEPHRSRRGSAPLDGEADEPAADPILSVERLFMAWTAEAGSRVLLSAFNSVQVQLGRVRRLEPLVLDDLEAESLKLAALSHPAPRAERLAGLRQFHGRRIRVAEALAALLSRPPEGQNIERI